jgi:hypothetical protein
MRTRCTGHTTIAAEVSVDTESRRMTPLGRSRSRRGGAAEDTIAQMKSAMTFGLGVSLKANPRIKGGAMQASNLTPAGHADAVTHVAGKRLRHPPLIPEPIRQSLGSGLPTGPRGGFPWVRMSCRMPCRGPSDVDDLA